MQCIDGGFLVRATWQTWPNCELKAIGSILNPLAGKFSEDNRKKGKGAVWLPHETDYSYFEFEAPNVFKYI